MTKQAFICDAIRTPIGRYGGGLAPVRTDDLGAIPIKALMARNPNVKWDELDDAIYGCANQAGEDNRNVAHMATLLAGLPTSVAGDAFDFSVINLGGASEVASITVNTDVTIVGNAAIPVPATGVQSSGLFRARKTADHVFVVYRIA